MRRSNIAFIISVALHLICLLIFMGVRVESEYRKASGSVEVDLTKITDPKLLVKRQKPEPPKPQMMDRKTEVDRPNRVIEPTTSAKFIPTRTDRGTPALKSSMLPTDLKMPATGDIGNVTFGQGIGRVDTQKVLKAKKSQLVDFVNRLKGRREIIYCLDISASMGAPGSNKLNIARKYLVESLMELTENDSFNIIVFSKESAVYNPSGTIMATRENISNAVSYLNQFNQTNIRTNTKTDLLSPIILALGMKPNIVVVVTDGLPTVGVIQPEKILQEIRNANTGSKIFAIGMEMDEDQPEAWLLKSIAEQNDGEFQLL
ncbi:MAG: vWA domain-containing protein [Candidatus Poribacteria bacterium]